MQNITLAKQSIENFSIDEGEYSDDAQTMQIHGNGQVFVRGEEVLVKANINFGETNGCKVFIGRNVKGNFSATFKGNDSLLFIGNGCRLNRLEIRSFQENDFIAIGNQVTTASTNTWISGNGAGNAKPAIIIGDDCMFSYDVVIRNSDAHPIFNISNDEQINQPKGIVHIEPHVWIGEQVSILKSVKIGACSIISLGAIVTKDVPRFSVASGVPAVSKIKTDIYWARNENEQAKTRAKYFLNKFKDS
ncbi:acyltransferase [Synechococcus sp. BA-132 BA5]|uniref:acyltransferase n=1 Tax=Synechococcus sp. BA-132 BA5 TaxID=3110252 RepID=UPI002B1FE837|nr:acyltransferase [Synechococcus sp. BA-132 BA5]MEA5415565.1 acyltransferase [Synechococcus sp. BA-132 BA5]